EGQEEGRAGRPPRCRLVMHRYPPTEALPAVGESQVPCAQSAESAAQDRPAGHWTLDLAQRAAASVRHPKAPHPGQVTPAATEVRLVADVSVDVHAEGVAGSNGLDQDLTSPRCDDVLPVGVPSLAQV